jgi:predicted PurR-regulated permease PerM
MNTRYPLTMRVAFLLLSVILFFYAIIEAKLFLYPIVLGALLGYLVYPVACFLEKKNVPRILANLLGIVFLMAVVGSAVFFIYKRAGSLLDDLPFFKEQAMENIDKLETLIEKQFGVSDLRLVEFLRLRIRNLFEEGSNFMNNLFSQTAGTVFRIGILPVYIFLFLYYRTKLAMFILKMVPSDQKLVGVKVLKEFALVVPRYMGGVSTVVLILSFINTGALFIAGAEYPIVFGIISASCSFIPYFGTLIGAAIPLSFTLLTADTPIIALRVAALFAVIHSLENNILTPNIVGNSLRLNPMVIIIGVIAGGMVWGVPGMFAVVPLLAMVNVLSENVERLNAYSYLLGVKGTRRHAITIENIRRFRQKVSTWFHK